VGNVINLQEARADRSRPSRSPAAFFFALDCPISYLAAERVERALGEIEWVPVATPSSTGGGSNPSGESNHWADERFALAEHEARQLRLPLVQPERYPLVNVRPIARAALLAADLGAGARFGLVASRFAFCGGYDLSDESVIAEVAIASDLPVDDVITASHDSARDAALEATTNGMHSRGLLTGPAIRVGTRWFEGLEAVVGASSFAATRGIYGAPAGR
jgi:2-hydroxychromene-2-carboxylate isomerase